MLGFGLLLLLGLLHLSYARGILPRESSTISEFDTYNITGNSNVTKSVDSPGITDASHFNESTLEAARDPFTFQTLYCRFTLIRSSNSPVLTSVVRDTMFTLFIAAWERRFDPSPMMPREPPFPIEHIDHPHALHFQMEYIPAYGPPPATFAELLFGNLMEAMLSYADQWTQEDWTPAVLVKADCNFPRMIGPTKLQGFLRGI